MKINRYRLEHLLNANGFVLHKTNGISPSFGFVRNDEYSDLYQRIVISFAGRKSEAVFADLAISATRWFRVKGLTESIPFVEIDKDQERGWTVIEDTSQGIEWEENLAKYSLITMNNFANKTRDALSQGTQKFRTRARVLLEQLNPAQFLEEQILSLKDKSSAPVFTEAERLANFPGIIQLQGTSDIYLLSCFILLRADGDGEFFGQDPLMNQDLMWQIQLIADGILSWDGMEHYRKL